MLALGCSLRTNACDYSLLADGAVREEEKERIRNRLPGVLCQTRVKTGDALLCIYFTSGIEYTCVLLLLLVRFLPRIAALLFLGLETSYNDIEGVDDDIGDSCADSTSSRIPQCWKGWASKGC